jgi:hypothetical protein
MWNEEDKIRLEVNFRYKLNRPAKAIVGIFIIKDLNGKELARGKIKVSKGLFNFFKGTTIKPNEVVTVSLDIPYNPNDETSVKILKTPLNRLKFEFIPTQVVFEDGDVIYYKKDW